MIPLGRRLRDFGISGTAFWFIQLVVLSSYSGPKAGWYAWPRQPADHLISLFPTRLQGSTAAIAAVLATLAILGIFLTGMVLDALPSAYFPFELILFAQHIRNNKWLSQVFDQESTEFRQAYQYFDDASPSLDEWKKIPEWWKHYAANLHYLSSYIAVYSEMQSCDILDRSHERWRTGRGIGQSMAIAAAEVLALSTLGLWFWGAKSSLGFGWTVLVILLLLGGGLFISLNTFQTFCHDLFTLALLVNRKRTEDALTSQAATSTDGTQTSVTPSQGGPPPS